MEITYLGRSAFRLRGKDVTIVTDPYAPDTSLSMGKPQAQIVTVSRRDKEHGFVDGVSGDPRVVAGPGEYEVADVLIAGVATERQSGRGTINTAYVLRFEELALCHLGQTTTKLSNDQIEELGSINVLFVPVGSGGALGPTEAAEVVSQLEPSVVIPMRYRQDGAGPAGLETVDQFIREMGSKEFVAESKFAVTRSSLPSEVRIVVLESRRI